MPNDLRFFHALARVYHKAKHTITNPSKTQAASIALVLLLMLVAGFMMLRSSRHSNSNPEIKNGAASKDSATFHADAPDTASLFLDSVPLFEASLARDSATTAGQITLRPANEASGEARSEAPALSDTLQRFGSHATQMQMLIELLEEKQLLMEEKVELSRRLEITEILDSALVHKTALDSTAQSPAPSDALELETGLRHKLDTLENTFRAQKPDTLSPRHKL